MYYKAMVRNFTIGDVHITPTLAMSISCLFVVFDDYLVAMLDCLMILLVAAFALKVLIMCDAQNSFKLAKSSTIVHALNHS